MSCTRELSITITEEEAEDMPLHSAVYDPTRGKIFAVRGGRVFKFNEDTLAKEDEVVYNGGPTLSDSYICYDAGRDKLWVTYSPNFVAPPGNTSPTNDKYIIKLNADSLATEQTVGVDANNLDPGVEAYLANNVIRHITSNGVQLAFWMLRQGNTNGTAFIVFNPDSLPGAVFNRNFTTSRWAFIQVYPSSTDYQLVTDDHYNDGVQRYTNANAFVENGEGYPAPGFNATTKRIYGFAFHLGSNKCYCANRSNLILKLDASNAGGSGTAIDLGAVIDVWNIRLSPIDGKLYAPDIGGSNTVAVIDPSDDSFVLKGGFNSPWDVVFTASKAVAVQHSAEGLKEIV